MTKPSRAQLRKQVYGFLKETGYKFEKDNQSKLSNILKSVYENRVAEMLPNKPLVHEIVCPKCQGVRIKKGKQFKKYKQSIRRAGGDAPLINPT